jgi:hypothetical protein
LTSFTAPFRAQNVFSWFNVRQTSDSSLAT